MPDARAHGLIRPFHRSTVPPFHRSTVPPFHRSTVPPFHRSHSLFRLVMMGYDASLKALRLEQLEAVHPHVLEDSRSLTERERKNEHADFVHEPALEQTAREFSHAVLKKCYLRRFLEPRDAFGTVALDERRAPLKRGLQRSGRNVLRHGVDPIGHFPLPRRPNMREPLVGLPAHDEGVRHEQELVEVRLNVSAVEPENLSPERRLVPTDHSIQRHLDLDNQLAHEHLTLRKFRPSSLVSEA